MANQFPDPQAASDRITGELEGGYKPTGKLGDPNAAMWGINQSTFDDYRRRKGVVTQDVRLMTPEERAEIYADYWTRYFCPKIAARSGALAVAHFDCEFNGGGTVVLEQVIGELPKDRDAVLTEEEVDQFLELLDGESGEDGVIDAYLQDRLDRLRGLTRKRPDGSVQRLWDDAGAVWTKRLDTLAEFLGVSWRVS